MSRPTQPRTGWAGQSNPPPSFPAPPGSPRGVASTAPHSGLVLASRLRLTAQAASFVPSFVRADHPDYDPVISRVPDELLVYRGPDQSSAISASAPRPGGPELPVPPGSRAFPFRARPAATDYIRELAPDAQFAPAGRLNPHAECAAERQLAGVAAFSYVASNHEFGRQTLVYEVGANAVRSSKWQGLAGTSNPTFSLMPRLLPGDNRRIATARDSRLDQGSYCHCRLQDCPHVASRPVGRAVLLFVHSAYYFEPTDIAVALARSGAGCALSVEHSFPDVAGSLCNGSLRYHIGRDGLLHAQASGNAEQYHHSPCLWRLPGRFVVEPRGSDSSGSSLVWCVLERFGDTNLVRYDLIEGGDPLPAAPASPLFRRSVQVSDHLVAPDTALVTAVNKAILTPSYTAYCAPLRAAFYFGGLYVLTKRNDEVVPIPRGLIGSLTLLATGKERTPALYQQLVARGRRICIQLNMPDDLASDATIYASIAAMAAAENELIALGRSSALFSRLWQRHARTLRLEAITAFSLELDRATQVAIATSIPSIYMSGVVPAAGHGAITAVLFMTAHPFLPALALPAAAYGLYSYLAAGAGHHSDEASAWVTTRDLDGLSLPTGVPVVPLAAAHLFRGYLSAKTSSPRLDPQAVITRHRPDALGRDATDTPGLRLQGIAFTTCTPSYVPSTEDAAILALHTRLFQDYEPAEDPVAWDRLIARLNDSGSALNELVASPPEWPDDPSHLLPPFLERYPAAARAELQIALDSFADSPPNAEDFKVEIIVKREKTGMSTADGITNNDPRPVISFSPRFNALHGPYIYFASQHTRAVRAWAPDAYILRAIQSTTEQLGEFYDRHSAHFRRNGALVRACGDFARFDGRQRAGALRFKLAFYAKLGVPSEVLHAISVASHLRGVIKKKEYIKFRSKQPRQASGIGWTTDSNCAINEAVVEDIFGKPGPDTYALMDLGDDFSLIGGPCIDLSEAEVNRRLAPFGLQATFHVCRDDSDFEFVSLLPWPTSDGTVFGPKIGRQLHRGGWSTSSEHTDIYGAALSMQKAAGFIPFLRHYYETHRRLAVPREDHRDHHLATSLNHQATPETYEFLARRYDLSADDEDAFRDLLSQVTSLPSLIDWSPIERLALRDA
jgi:hypothetical protein